MTDHPMDRISIIIPTLNEAHHISATIASAKRAENIEIFVVDGASTDDTVKKAKSAGAKTIATSPGRAEQMNIGAAGADGDILLFLHADTLLPSDYDGHVRRSLSDSAVAAGAFKLAIDGPGWSLRVMERVANWRSRYLQMPYGDQALFVPSRLFRQLGGYHHQPIMEDFVLVRRLKRVGRIDIIPAPVLTSARRWLKLGPWQTWLVNQAVIFAYHLGASPDKLAAFYRRGSSSRQ